MIQTPTITTTKTAAQATFDAGNGIVRLAPTWVPRVFSTPGRRLRLHPNDYYPFGKGRGGIDERWIASPIRADNGPETGPHEGLSLVATPDGAFIPFDVFVDHIQAPLVGEDVWSEHRKWPVLGKFFDNEQALPFHMHHRQIHATPLGKIAKPESYYYPPQLNNHLGLHPVSFLGLRPSATKDDVRAALLRFLEGGDNRITDLSIGYRTKLATGWDVPAGVLHAPASALTFEPQAASDVLCMCESWSNNMEVPRELMWKDCPDDKFGDIDYILDLIDWDTNTDPDFALNRFMTPQASPANAPESGLIDKWIVYKSDLFSAKETTIAPGTTVILADPTAYGLIVIQGHGLIGDLEAESIGMARFGQMTSDEFFVSAAAAGQGVIMRNASRCEPLVLLRHFALSMNHQSTMLVESPIAV